SSGTRMAWLANWLRVTFFIEPLAPPDLSRQYPVTWRNDRNAARSGAYIFVPVSTRIVRSEATAPGGLPSNRHARPTSSVVLLLATRTSPRRTMHSAALAADIRAGLTPSGRNPVSVKHAVVIARTTVSPSLAIDLEGNSVHSSASRLVGQALVLDSSKTERIYATGRAFAIPSWALAAARARSTSATWLLTAAATRLCS